MPRGKHSPSKRQRWYQRLRDLPDRRDWSIDWEEIGTRIGFAVLAVVAVLALYGWVKSEDAKDRSRDPCSQEIGTGDPRANETLNDYCGNRDAGP